MAKIYNIGDGFNEAADDLFKRALSSDNKIHASEDFVPKFSRSKDSPSFKAPEYYDPDFEEGDGDFEDDECENGYENGLHGQMISAIEELTFLSHDEVRKMVRKMENHFERKMIQLKGLKAGDVIKVDFNGMLEPVVGLVLSIDRCCRCCEGYLTHEEVFDNDVDLLDLHLWCIKVMNTDGGVTSQWLDETMQCNAKIIGHIDGIGENINEFLEKYGENG